MVKSATIKRRKRPAPLSLTDARDPNLHACFDYCHAYTPHTRALCQYGHCTEFYCDGCGRYSWGVGPAGCRCDWSRKGSGGFGHRTKAEQPRRSMPIKGRGRSGVSE